MRGNAQHFQLTEHGFVDQILGDRPLCNLCSQRNCGAERGNLTLIAGHNGHFAGEVVSGDQARRRHFGHFRIIGFKQRHAGHVFRRSITVDGEHGDLLLHTAIHHPGLRQAADAYH